MFHVTARKRSSFKHWKVTCKCYTKIPGSFHQLGQVVARVTNSLKTKTASFIHSAVHWQAFTTGLKPSYSTVHFTTSARTHTRLWGVARAVVWAPLLFSSGAPAPGSSRGFEWWRARCQRRRRKRHRFDPWVGKIPWRRAWPPTPGFMPGEPHGRRRLVGYSPEGRTEPDTTEGLSMLALPSRGCCWHWGSQLTAGGHRVVPNFRRKSSEAHPPKPEEGTAKGPVPLATASLAFPSPRPCSLRRFSCRDLPREFPGQHSHLRLCF